MSEWQPIETYDALGLKPKWAVFYVKATGLSRTGGHSLREMVVVERRFGFREITHWMPLPQPPKDPQ